MTPVGGCRYRVQHKTKEYNNVEIIYIQSFMLTVMSDNIQNAQK